MNKLLYNLLLLICTFGVISTLSVSPAIAAIEVVAATPELADITRQIGGDKVSVYSIAKPNQDYHRIEARPSDVSRIARADMVLRVGLDLELWLDALLNAAGNSQVNRGGLGYVDTSVGISLLQVPRGQITGASGDIHVYGNPHYFYDPEAGKIIARNILQGLERISPDDRTAFQANYQRFISEIDRRMAVWQKELEPYKGRAVVNYHQSTVYFLHRFGLKEFGTIELKPGIPPSASYIRDLTRRMKAEKVTAMVIDSIYPTQFPDLVARETGIKYLITPYSVGSLGTKDYFEFIDLIVKRYKEALR